jgi:hypothetical protein
MMSKRLVRIGLVGLGVSIGVLGAQGRQAYTVYGHGRLSCEKWPRSKTVLKVPTEVVAQVSWVLGFVSGVGFASSTALKPSHPGEMELWIEDYCTKNPSAQLRDAAEALVNTLLAK